MADGIQKKVRAGLAQLLATAGVVTWTTSGAVSLTANPPPIFDQVLPEKPDICAALSTYATGGDEPTLSGSALMLQVRTRCSLTDTAAGDDLDDAIAGQIMGRFPVTLANGVVISTVVRSSGSPIGRDAAGRMERTTNYRLVVHDPGPYRG